MKASNLFNVEEINGIRAGDTVEIIGDHPNSGHSAKVISPKDGGTLKWFHIHTTGLPDKGANAPSVHNVKLVKEKEMTKFKLGDKVEIVKSGTHGFSVGHVGVITYVDDSTSKQPYRVDDEMCNWVYDHEIKLAGKYRVGDVYENEGYNYTRTIIAVGEYKGKDYVLTVDSDDEMISVDSLYGWEKQGDIKELTLEDVAKLAGVDVKNLGLRNNMTEFKVGDKVKRVGGGSNSGMGTGDIGVVDRLDSYSSFFDVRMDKNGRIAHNCSKGFYELVKDENEIEVGDILVAPNQSKRKVIALIEDEGVEFIVSKRMTLALTRPSLNRKSYILDSLRYKKQVAQKEFTLQEIAEKMGVDVSELRIKE